MESFKFREELFLGKVRLNRSVSHYKGNYVIFHQTYKDDFSMRNGNSTKFYFGEDRNFLEGYVRGVMFGKTPEDIQIYRSIPKSRSEIDYPRFEFENFDKRELENILKEIGSENFLGKVKEEL